ncbi:hypothetical protein FC18_GL000802 [Lacticaseibacillus sharpeae JCM 1186 = DSM 20505]|uniref:Uncharacterized protein n=1 Tax=Lacticaseibacillus sharpeae JCM 1186 = DSM 20505 TaxID=1291052 RepID=A0A0R1ZY32_9LACO|nr:hypothetical protein FC18_GL000802 [Lacticaseibacillus sharpeae JCM 1186 = DSM 20505]
MRASKLASGKLVLALIAFLYAVVSQLTASNPQLGLRIVVSDIQFSHVAATAATMTGTHGFSPQSTDAHTIFIIS